MNLKRLLAFSLVFLVFTSLRAQGPEVEVWYEVAIGPANTDTVNVYMRSAKVTPIDISAVDFSMVFDSTCTQFQSVNALFTTIWGSIFEVTREEAFTVTYNSITYNKRFSYGNNALFGTPLTLGPVNGPLLKVMTVIFSGLCGQSLVMEHENQNSLNQIGDANIVRLDYNLFRINPILDPGLLFVKAESVDPTSALVSWEMTGSGIHSTYIVEKWQDGKFVFISPEISTPTQYLASGKLSYDFTDPDAAATYAMYRLQMIDQDGRITWSDRVEMFRGEKTEVVEILVYPNPSTGIFTLTTGHFEETPYTVRVYNTMGDQVWKQTLNLVPGKETILNLTGFPSGPYQVIWEDLKGENLIHPVRVVVY